MSSSTAAVQQHRPASPAQLDYARGLGLEVTDGQSGREVRRMISREVYRRGGQTIDRLKPRLGDRFEHPRNGVSEVTRVNPQTRKVTLCVVSSQRKYVVDAMYLGTYPRVLTDAQLIEFFGGLSRITDWCTAHQVKVVCDGAGRITWPKDSWEKARQIAGQQLSQESR